MLPYLSPSQTWGETTGGNAGQHGEAAAMINLALHATTHIFEAAQELLEAWCNFLGFLLGKFKTVPGCSFWLFRFFFGVCVGRLKSVKLLYAGGSSRVQSPLPTKTLWYPW